MHAGGQGRLRLQHLYVQGGPVVLLRVTFPLQFQDSGGNNMTCANNCKGVDPNSVIIGGTALLAVASVG